ncbi:MAG: phage major capsid protein [Alistipes sp.]|nr:phage major capsid protein [Alistipes sp.]
MRIKKLMEERNAKVAEMRSLNEAAKAREEQRMTKEESEQFRKLEAEVDSLDEEIRQAEKLEALDKRVAEQRAASQTPAEQPSQKEVELRAFANYLRDGRITEEVRTALTTENSAVMIPKEISQQIILGLQGQFELMSKFGLRITPHAKTFVEPILSGDMTLKRITVGAANDEGTAAFEGIEIKAYDYRLPVIPLSLTLLEGSDADIQGAIVALFTEHIARGLTKLALTGGTAADGVSALVPKVVVATAASATAITYSDLVDLLAKVKAPHSSQGVASWVMNSATRAALMKVLDQNGRPIFIESAREGEPDRILGRPVVIDDAMDDIGAGKTPILFGDLKKYVMRIVQGVKVRVYQEEKFYKDNCIGVQAFVTADGKLIAKTGVYEPIAGLKMKAS